MPARWSWMVALLIWNTPVSADDIPYTCRYAEATQIVPATCETLGGKLQVLCQYYTYPLNHVYCDESPTHRHDLCELSLDQVQLVPSPYKTVEECLAHPAELEALCDRHPPAPTVSGVAQCGG